MLISPTSSTSSLPSQNFWNRSMKSNTNNQEAQMEAARRQFLTLVFGDMETIRILPDGYTELEVLAREWVKPPPDVVFTLRVPVEYASLQAARLASGLYIYLVDEDSYLVAKTGVRGLRVEIISDAPPGPPLPDEPPSPPILQGPSVPQPEVNVRKLDLTQAFQNSHGTPNDLLFADTGSMPSLPALARKPPLHELGANTTSTSALTNKKSSVPVRRRAHGLAKDGKVSGALNRTTVDVTEMEDDYEQLGCRCVVQ